MTEEQLKERLKWLQINEPNELVRKNIKRYLRNWCLIKVKRPKISGSFRKRILERDKYRCVNCHSFKDLAIDHIKAFSEGGTNDIGNLRTLCKKCNSAKRDRKTLTTF